MKPRPKSVSRARPSPVPDRELVRAKIAQVKPKIVQTRAPVWATAWEDPYPLTRPLPRTTSYEQLDAERENLLKHLDWVTHTLTICNNKKALHEIQRIADRLTRIAAMTPKALETGIEDGRLMMSDDVPF
jgi:hypothetical protein